MFVGVLFAHPCVLVVTCNQGITWQKKLVVPRALLATSLAAMPLQQASVALSLLTHTHATLTHAMLSASKNLSFTLTIGTRQGGAREEEGERLPGVLLQHLAPPDPRVAGQVGLAAGWSQFSVVFV